jgi:hypothetical protein
MYILLHAVCCIRDVVFDYIEFDIYITGNYKCHKSIPKDPFDGV